MEYNRSQTYHHFTTTYLVCNLYIDAVHTRDMDVGSELGPHIQTQIMNMDVETAFCHWSHLKGNQ